ncbi:MAG: 50S ribosomal protein L3 [Actinomycetota bacterium]|nr:50S ribosomal protein L3 [Actinomycetota bacterium]
MQGLLGKKIGMTQVFGDGDQLIPVTVIEAGPCVVTQIKTTDTDGYGAIQIGFGVAKEKHVNRPSKGHFDKAKVEPKRHLAEFMVDDPASFKLGQELTVETFVEGERANVVGWSKGKGFTGVMKRWNFKGGPGGHGAHFHRAPGSIGMAATPSRVIKGTKLPGQHGNARNTISNLKIIKVDAEQNILLIKGAVPGPNGALVLIKKTQRAART